MLAGLAQLKHIVVLMMENRSFDHMLGYLKQQDPRIEGIDGTQSNPDTTGAIIPVEPKAEYQAQLQPDPGHHFPDVRLQIFGEPEGGPPMQGFIKAYYQKEENVEHSHKIMYCFPPEKVPVITTLARKYAVFNHWYSSLPGPTVPNRAFAHFGTSFGKTSMSLFYLNEKYKTIYERMVAAGRSAKIYYFDQQSATIGLVFMLQQQPKLFGTWDQFLADCRSGNLPDYSFIEPNYTDHNAGGGSYPASDQHPDHNVLAGEEFIAATHMAILNNEELWNSTMLLIVYDEHGGIYDHVEPPACTPDEFQDPETGFRFDRLGIRVPAVLVSPWVPEGTVVNRTFDHASIPATVTEHFIGDYTNRSPRETTADRFLDLLTLDKPRTDYIGFSTGASFDPADPHAGDYVPIVPPPDDVAQPTRELSLLLRDHVDALREVEETMPPDRQTHIDTNAIKTEEQASAYIAAVIARMQPDAAPPAKE